jgi:hypothetical protein
MGKGQFMVYGCAALEALNEFKQEQKSTYLALTLDLFLTLNHKY